MLNNILYKLNNLTKKYRKKSIEDLTISFDDPDFNVKSKELLHNNGILIIQDVFSNNTIDLAYKEVYDFFLSDKTEIFNHHDYYEKENVAYQKNMVHLKTYKEINDYPVPVVNMRSDDLLQADGGMIDIFNFEKLNNFSEFNGVNEIHHMIRKNTSFHNLLSNFINDFSASSTHIYVNEGVINPRAIHFDNLNSTYKVFVYLTDVLEMEYGPYSYVPGSHSKDNYIRRVHKLNKVFKRYTGDTPFFNRKLALPILGKKGTVIISCQNGLHGGIPQSKDKMRVMYVDTFL